MTRKLDYRIIQADLKLKFDYIEEERYNEFYSKIKTLCEEYNVHIQRMTVKEDVMEYE